MASSWIALQRQADSLGLSAVRLRVASTQSPIKIWGDRAPHNYDEGHHIYALKGYAALEVFLDGFLIGRRQDVGEMKGSIAEM
jgi:hypothetical protein